MDAVRGQNVRVTIGVPSYGSVNNEMFDTTLNMEQSGMELSVTIHMGSSGESAAVTVTRPATLTASTLSSLLMTYPIPVHCLGYNSFVWNKQQNFNRGSHRGYLKRGTALNINYISKRLLQLAARMRCS